MEVHAEVFQSLLLEVDFLGLGSYRLILFQLHVQDLQRPALHFGIFVFRHVGVDYALYLLLFLPVSHPLDLGLHAVVARPLAHIASRGHLGFQHLGFVLRVSVHLVECFLLLHLGFLLALVVNLDL